MDQLKYGPGTNYEGLDRVHWLLINGFIFLLAADFSPKSLLTTDYYAEEFND